MKITLDLQKLTLREIDDLETAAGVLLRELDGKPLPTRALQAMVWIAQRRENPAFTFEDAGDIVIDGVEFAGPPSDAGLADSSVTSRRSATSTTSRRKASGV